MLRAAGPTRFWRFRRGRCPEAAGAVPARSQVGRPAAPCTHRGSARPRPHPAPAPLCCPPHTRSPSPTHHNPRELTTLDLGGNDIGPEGAKALGEALGGHPALKSVELGYNPLGPEGAETLANTFKFDTKARPWVVGGGGLGFGGLGQFTCGCRGMGRARPRVHCWGEPAASRRQHPPPSSPACAACPPPLSVILVRRGARAG